MSLERSELDIFTDHTAARQAAEAVSGLVEFDTSDLQRLRFKQHRSWVYANNGGENPDLIIKVEPDADGTLLEERQKSVGHTRDLFEAGAPVEEHLIEPTRVAVARAAGGLAMYVVTSTEYLPSEYNKDKDDYTSYGSLMAKFHTFGSQFVDTYPSFDPLKVAKRTYEKLLKLQEQDRLPRLGEHHFDEKLVARLGRMVARGEAQAEELMALNEKKGHPPALLHNDITPFNARRDREGRGKFIDLDRCEIGPWAYDFGRPLEWWRFHRSDGNLATLVAGYADRARWPVDQEMLKLGGEIAHVRYAATLMTRVADMALKGAEPNEYLLSESIRRIRGEKYWHSEEEHIAKQTQCLQAENVR